MVSYHSILQYTILTIVYIHIYIYICIYIYIYIIIINDYIIGRGRASATTCTSPRTSPATRRSSEGGTTRLETLIELEFLDSSFSSSNCSIRAFRPYPLAELDKRFPVERFEAAVSRSAVPSSPLAFAASPCPSSITTIITTTTLYSIIVLIIFSIDLCTNNQYVYDYYIVRSSPACGTTATSPSGWISSELCGPGYTHTNTYIYIYIYMHIYIYIYAHIDI